MAAQIKAITIVRYFECRHLKIKFNVSLWVTRQELTERFVALFHTAEIFLGNMVNLVFNGCRNKTIASFIKVIPVGGSLSQRPNT